MIELSLSSPFWEDPSDAMFSGEDHLAAMRICVEALQAAGYTIQVRDADGELRDLEDSDLEPED